MARQTPTEIRNDKLGPIVAENLKKHYFDAYYCSARDEAAQLILSLIPQEDVVSWGGSVTVEQLGIQTLLAERGQTVIDRSAGATREEQQELMRQALLCDTFLTSSNAVSEDGQLFNIDGNGNRVAAMIFGPKQVIVAVGMNKVVKTPQDAMERARTIAAPLNSQRFTGKSIPCAATGSCANCLSPETICCTMVCHRVSRPAGRIKVILIGEELGL